MPLKVLYTGLGRENYNPTRGFSFEYNNFYLTLKNMKGVQIIEYPFDRILEVGKKKFNDELLELVKREKPDLLFAFMYTDELDKDTLRAIRRETKTKTVAWFADDYWRFWNYSRHWPPYFDWIVTTYSKALEWYRRAGFTNVIRSQWACNTAVYKPFDVPKDIDVSFVGQWKPQRGRVVDFLRKSGIHVQTFGFGWGGGRISQEEMLKVFSRSRINLNLNVRPGLLDPRVVARVFFKKSANKLIPDFHLLDNLRAYFHFPILHTHARPFELAGCRAFTISGRSEDIAMYYKEGEEMVFFDSREDLIKKVQYYLAHDDARAKIADAAYARTIREHTYEKRFEDIFKTAGFGRRE